MSLVIKDKITEFLETIESFVLNRELFGEIPEKFLAVDTGLHFKFIRMLVMIHDRYFPEHRRDLNALFNITVAVMYKYHYREDYVTTPAESGASRSEMKRLSFRNRCYETLRNFIRSNPEIFVLTHKPGTMPDVWDRRFTMLTGDHQMVVDNFELIAEKIVGHQTQHPDLFWYIEIIARKKENPEQHGNSRLIRTFEIDSATMLHNKKPDIVDYCRRYNARAYFRVNRRSKRRIAAEMIKSLTEQLLTDDFRLHKTHEKCLGKFPYSGDRKLWLLDVDAELGYDESDRQRLVTEIQEIFRRLNPRRTDDLYHVWLPTVTGHHLVIEAFPLKCFHDHHPEVAVHQDNGTILYYERNYNG